MNSNNNQRREARQKADLSAKGRIIVISAPSGSGKGTIISEMRKLRPSLALSVSMTTRTPRTGETDGVHYHFTTRENFKKLDEEGYFLESSPYSAMGNLYGTPLAFADEVTDGGGDLVLEIEVNGMRQVRRLRPEAVTFFIMPHTRDAWEKQLRERDETLSDDERAARIETGLREIEAADEYDYTVVNRPGDPAAAAAEILELLEKHRTSANTM